MIRAQELQENEDVRKMLLGQRIIVLDLRCPHLLEQQGIKTINDLISLTPSEFLNLRGVGPKTLNDVNKKLGFLGLKMSSSNNSISELKFKKEFKLRRIGINSIQDLTKYTETQILEIEGIGPKLLESLKLKMLKYGVSFKIDGNMITNKNQL